MQTDIGKDAPPIGFMFACGAIIALCVTLIILAVEQGIADFKQWRRKRLKPARVDPVVGKFLDDLRPGGGVSLDRSPRRIK